MGQKSKQITGRFFTFPPQIYHFAGIPVFYLAFTLFYSPFDTREFLNMYGWHDFNVTMIASICLLCLVGTRLAFFFLKKVMKMTYLAYAAWCAAEILICTLFASLYVTLMKELEMSYFAVTAKMFGQMSSTLIYPYIILAGGIAISGSRDAEQASEESIIRFRDENNTLKLAIASDTVLYLESKDNYVLIWYVENERLKSFKLRSSIKRLEQMLVKHGLVRCQRSYFINPAHIQVLRKDTSGFIFADLDNNHCPAIPVSKTYYDSLSSML